MFDEPALVEADWTEVKEVAPMPYVSLPGPGGPRYGETYVERATLADGVRYRIACRPSPGHEADGDTACVNGFDLYETLEEAAEEAEFWASQMDLSDIIGHAPTTIIDRREHAADGEAIRLAIGVHLPGTADPDEVVDAVVDLVEAANEYMIAHDGNGLVVTPDDEE